jgi:hypothetical protein
LDIRSVWVRGSAFSINRFALFSYIIDSIWVIK